MQQPDEDMATDASPPYFLGLNCAHDAAACIVGEDGILVAIREERLSRKKYQEGFPARAIRYCLDALGLNSFDAIAGAAINQYPKQSCEFELRDMGYRGPISINPSHHMLHAYYAKYFTDARDCIIAVVDGSGYNYGEYKRNKTPMLGDEIVDDDADEADAVFVVRGGKLELICKRWGIWESSSPYFRFPSFGHTYAVAAQHIYNDVRGWLHTGKVMGLAPLGSLEAGIPPALQTKNGSIIFDLDWFRSLPPVDERPDYWNDLNRQNIAARVQHDIEIGLATWLRSIAKPELPRAVCLTGGVTHNSVANGKLATDGAFDEYFFTPAADDGGLAIGSALYAFETAAGRPPAAQFQNDFHGRVYSPDEARKVVEHDPRLMVTVLEDDESFASDAAGSLASGKFIALHDGGSEFSARALGHRSILCDPRIPDGKAKLNGNIKFREEFRPYAVMVLEEHAGDYFEMKTKSPYMMVVANVYAEVQSEIAAVCHVDGTCRVQTVGADYQGAAGAILRAFYAQTGFPMILNTSLNVRGEPMVETPGEAVECLCATGLDALYLYPYRLEKHPLSWDADDAAFMAMVPVVNPGFSVQLAQEAKDGRLGGQSHTLRSKTGYIQQIVLADYEALLAIDGQTNVEELVAQLSEGREALCTLRRLNRIGTVSFTRGAQ